MNKSYYQCPENDSAVSFMPFLTSFCHFGFLCHPYLERGNKKKNQDRKIQPNPFNNSHRDKSGNDISISPNP